MPVLPLTRRFGQPRRQHLRLHARAVVVLDEIDGLLVDVREHLGRDRGHARFRVAHRGRWIAVDGAEVALAVDQWIAQREQLGEPDECVIQRDVAVRVVLAHHLADDRGALAVAGRRGQPHLVHRVQDPAVYGLEAVADVGQGAADDDAHRVVEVAGPQLVLDPDGQHASRRLFSHPLSALPRSDRPAGAVAHPACSPRHPPCHRARRTDSRSRLPRSSTRCPAPDGHRRASP